MDPGQHRREIIDKIFEDVEYPSESRELSAQI
jgi:hypothetical protein